MARTMSAIRRPNFAVVGTSLIEGLAQSQAGAALTNIGRGDTQRGLLITLCATMTIIGAAAPLLHAGFVSALLLVTGAAVATLVLTAAPSGDRPRRPGASEELRRQTIINELCATRSERTALDRAAWARLTAHMSHEFRTPLNAVLGFSELMSSEALGPIGTSCYSDYARNIHNSGRRLLKSAEDALAITALLTAPERKGPPTVVSLQHAFDDAAAFHAHAFSDHKISINTDGLSDEFDVLAEAQTVRQLLINVLSDTAASAQAGSTIFVSTVRNDERVEMSLKLASANMKCAAESDSFSLLLARTLCELSGASLYVGPAGNGDTVWTVTFTSAAQHDLFSGL